MNSKAFRPQWNLRDSDGEIVAIPDRHSGTQEYDRDTRTVTSTIEFPSLYAEHDITQEVCSLWYGDELRWDDLHYCSCREYCTMRGSETVLYLGAIFQSMEKR